MFIVQKIRDRAGGNEVVDELKMVLDDETDKLVCLLWRLLIYETEARAAGM